MRLQRHFLKQRILYDEDENGDEDEVRVYDDSLSFEYPQQELHKIVTHYKLFVMIYGGKFYKSF